jgi:hypothetical protein
MVYRGSSFVLFIDLFFSKFCNLLHVCLHQEVASFVSVIRFGDMSVAGLAINNVEMKIRKFLVVTIYAFTVICYMFFCVYL